MRIGGRWHDGPLPALPSIHTRYFPSAYRRGSSLNRAWLAALENMYSRLLYTAQYMIWPGTKRCRSVESTGSLPEQTGVKASLLAWNCRHWSEPESR